MVIELEVSFIILFSPFKTLYLAFQDLGRRRKVADSVVRPGEKTSSGGRTKKRRCFEEMALIHDGNLGTFTISVSGFDALIVKLFLYLHIRQSRLPNRAANIRSTITRALASFVHCLSLDAIATSLMMIHEHHWRKFPCSCFPNVVKHIKHASCSPFPTPKPGRSRGCRRLCR